MEYNAEYTPLTRQELVNYLFSIKTEEDISGEYIYLKHIDDIFKNDSRHQIHSSTFSIPHWKTKEDLSPLEQKFFEYATSLSLSYQARTSYYGHTYEYWEKSDNDLFYPIKTKLTPQTISQFKNAITA